MSKIRFVVGTAVASLIWVAVVSGPAAAFGTPAPAGLSASVQTQDLKQDVAWVCRYGYYGRRCFWRPGYYAYGYEPGYYYRPHRPWGFYRPYRRWW
jgi:hypothetical protein